MSEDWKGIAAEVGDAIAEVGFTATLTRQATESGTDADAGTPWGNIASGSTVTPPQKFTVTVLDDGPKTRYSNSDVGALIPRTVRVLTVSATGEAPQMGDTITLPDGAFTLTRVMAISPGSIAVLYEVELSA